MKEPSDVYEKRKYRSKAKRLFRLLKGFSVEECLRILGELRKLIEANAVVK